MPKVNEIKKTMKTKFSSEMIKKFDFPAPKGNQPEEVLSLIDQMNTLLTQKECFAVMEEQGCCKDEKVTAPFQAFGIKHKNKSVEEKIELFDELETGHKALCHLNPDGTLSIYWEFKQKDKYQCVCRVIKRLYKERGEPVHVSSTFCGCCAGHVRNTYQYALGVKLQLKEIVSSPISTSGKKRCEFLFNIIEEM